MTTSNPIKWHGGKSYLAPWIISHFPKHTHYVEPFFGGGAVLFAKPDQWVEGHSEVVNDLNRDLANFWDVLRSEEDFQWLTRELEATPFDADLFSWSSTYDARNPFMQHETRRRAWWFFIRYRQSRQGLGRDFATLSRTRTRRGMNEQVSSWLSAIEGLPEAHERLKRVVILNDDAVKVIRQQDGPKTFFYLDPPYLHETRVTTGDYEHEMSDDQHEILLRTLRDVKGKFLLSGYRSSLYDGYADSHGWTRHEKEIDNKASSKKTKGRMTECLWCNY